MTFWGRLTGLLRGGGAVLSEITILKIMNLPLFKDTAPVSFLQDFRKIGIHADRKL